MQWLRLCHVPSIPRAKQYIALLPDYDRVPWISRANTQIAQIAQASPVGVLIKKLTPTLIEEAYKRATDTRRLVPPRFGPINARGRLAHEEAYISWYSDFEHVDLFTGEIHSTPESSKSLHVAHIVPKKWLRTAATLTEFTCVADDPFNTVMTRSVINEQMQTKGIYLGADMNGKRYASNKLWSPLAFPTRSRAAVARAVAYMALTYPYIHADERVGVGETDTQNGGMPLYFLQYDEIIELLRETPTDDEIVRAWVQFAVFGWCNPFDVSGEVRKLVNQSDSSLAQLLRARLHGTDLGSNMVAEELDKLGVQIAL
jgi:hypothetical protein